MSEEYAIPEVTLEVDSLLQQAMDAEGLSDFGDENDNEEIDLMQHVNLSDDNQEKKIRKKYAMADERRKSMS